jgi:DNA-binding MarR family transcriptional regulator
MLRSLNALAAMTKAPLEQCEAVRVIGVVEEVPQIARSRPVSRQHIQKLPNETIADGVIELVNNPAHQRSKLLQLTPKGETIFQEITAKIAQAAAGLSQDIDAADLQVAARVIRHLSAKLRRRLDFQTIRSQNLPHIGHDARTLLWRRYLNLFRCIGRENRIFPTCQPFFVLSP